MTAPSRLLAVAVGLMTECRTGATDWDVINDLVRDLPDEDAPMLALLLLVVQDAYSHAGTAALRRIGLHAAEEAL